MQISLRLFPEKPVMLDFSYYPKLAAALYQLIGNYDLDFASNLHDGKDFQSRIKLFGFSPLHSRQTEVHPTIPGEHKNGGLLFKGISTFVACSPWPELMSRMEQGARESQVLRIGSQVLKVQAVVMVPPPRFKEKMDWILRTPASAVTSWSLKGTRKKTFAMPDAPAHEMTCENLLCNNLIHKWRRLKEVRPDIAQAWLDGKEDIQEQDIDIEIMPFTRDRRYQRKSHHIKKSPVFSWIAPVRIKAPVAIQKIVWSCGLGQMNSMGFGVVEEKRQ